MAITQMIEIDGRQVPFKASAALPRIYMAKYGRDLIQDFNRLVEAIKPGEGNGAIDIKTLTIFENIAHTMAKYADPAVPEDADEWLEGFNTLSIYLIMPKIFELWGLNSRTEAEAKKNLDQLTAR